MDDFGLASAGTQVTFASCMDERHPPENIVDGSDRTFWITTGLFPHQIIMSFAAEIELDRIKTVTTNTTQKMLMKAVAYSCQRFPRKNSATTPSVIKPLMSSTKIMSRRSKTTHAA